MSTQEKMSTLAARVSSARSMDPEMTWALLVPPIGDPEWVVRVGSVECVGPDLDVALDIAIEVVS
jgi:hypothetical protein